MILEGGYSVNFLSEKFQEWLGEPEEERALLEG